MKKKVFLWILLIVLILAGIIGGILIASFITGSDDSNSAKTEQTSQIHSHSKPSSDIEKTSQDMKHIDSDKGDEPYAQNEKGNMSSSEVAITENKVYDYLGKLKIDEALNLLEEKVQNYEKDEISEPIYDLYQDVSFLQNVYETMKKVQNDEKNQYNHVDTEGVITILNNIKDPQVLLTALFVAGAENRNEVILNKESLNPIYDGKVKILQTDSINNEKMNEIHVVFPELKNEAKILFEIEGNQLFAYVVKTSDGYSRVYSIEAKYPDKVYYKTIQYWQKFEKRINK